MEDVNDNTPMFNHYQPSVTIKENAPPGIIASLEATDADEGPYGQVIYHLQEVGADKHLFTISTIAGKAIIKLIGKNYLPNANYCHQLLFYRFVGLRKTNSASIESFSCRSS